MHKALHPRDDVKRLYMSRKEGGRELTCIQDCVDTSIQRLEDYIKKYQGRLVTATRNNSDNTSINRTKKKKKKKEKRKKEKQTNKKNNNTENKNEKKNHWIDISSEKQAKSHTRKLGYD